MADTETPTAIDELAQQLQGVVDALVAEHARNPLEREKLLQLKALTGQAVALLESVRGA